MSNSNPHQEPDLNEGQGKSSEESNDALDQDAMDAAAMDALTEAEAAAPEALSFEETQGLEIASLKEKLLRAMADTENMRRRTEKEKEDAHNYAVTKFARDILSVSDNLRRALDNIPADAKENDAVKTLVTGVEMTESELVSTFSKHKIEVIEAEGKKFDPNFHQAVFEIEDLNVEPGTVLQVMQAGYVISGRLLRPSMVGVAKGGQKKTDVHVDQSA